MYVWWKGAGLDLEQNGRTTDCSVDIGELGSNPDIEKKK
jgi:hypothetical protein